MALTGEGISFYPLWWIFHDQWQWHWTTGYYTTTHHYGYHCGHAHFFMMGFDATSIQQQAYNGTMKYEFSLNDLWSPRSNDPNQTKHTQIVGTPKWYFKVREFWRRVYIQQWDNNDNTTTDEIVGKKGIKWDASRANWGPFREGKDSLCYYINNPRTLPVEYYINENKTVRQHHIRKGPAWTRNPAADTPTYYDPIDPENIGRYDYENEESNADGYGIPDGFWAGGENNIYSDGHYADNHYIYPTLEYQGVTHLDWERESGWESRPDGDGFDVTIEIPYKVNGIIQSPFSNESGVVGAPGNYYHDVVPEDQKIRYASWPYTVYPSGHAKEGQPYVPGYYEPTAAQQGQLMGFNVPSGMDVDGKWVEQCLGAIVQAKAEIKYRDAYGKEQTTWVHTTQLIHEAGFEGSDQREGV